MMEIIFALNGTSLLAVAALTFFIFYKFLRKGDFIAKIGRIIAVNGVFYLIFGLLNFFWVFGVLEHTSADFIIADVALTVFSSVLMLYAVYKITGNKNLVYLSILFIITIFAINQSVKAFVIATLGASYLLLTIVFLELVVFSNFYLRWAGYLGLSYSIASILMSALAYFNVDYPNLYWFIRNTLMFFVFLFLYLDVQNIGVEKPAGKKRKQIAMLSYGSLLLKFSIFIITMSAFMLVSSIAIHELGHAFTAQYYGCEKFKAVIYDIIAPHTEIRCGPAGNNFIITIAGLAATAIIGLIFMLTGGEFTKGLSYLLFGFGLLIFYGDSFDLGMSNSLIVLQTMLSLFIIIVAIVSISLYYLRQQQIFMSQDKNMPEYHEEHHEERYVKIGKILKNVDYPK